LSRKRKNSPQPASLVRPPVPQDSPSIAPPSPNPRTLLHLTILILISLALYAPTLRNDFVTDDKLQILQNPLVLEGKNLGRAFTADVWSFALGSKYRAGLTNYYRPLQLLVYTAEYQLFGDHPAYWHLFNILLNAADVALVYLLLASLATPALGFWTAFWFAVHPMHSEPVAWVAALPELQCTFFLLLSMLCYHRARSGGKPLPQVILGALFFLAALLSKEAALLFPVILICYEFFYAHVSRAELRTVALRLAAYLAMLVIYLFARINALGGFAPHHNPDLTRLSLGQLFFLVPDIFARYIGKLLVPIHMNYFYDLPIITSLTVWAAAGFLASLLFAFGAFYFRSNRPVLSFALCWFVFTLAPALSLNSVGVNFFTERYLYIPSVGFAVFVATLTLAISSQSLKSWLRVSLSAVLAAMLVFYIVQLERRVAIFHDNFTLLSDAAMKSPNSYNIQAQVAAAYYEHGDVDRAIEHVLISLQSHPNNVLAQMNAGWYLTDKGKYEDAIAHLKEASRLLPDYVPPLINLAKVYILQNNWPLAAETYRHAAALDPSQAAYFSQLASVADSNSKSVAAISSLQSNAKANPRDFRAWVQLGDASSQTGLWNQAAFAYQNAAALQPTNATVLDKWGVSLLRMGAPVQAAAVLQRAVQAQPDSLYIRQGYAGALASSNRLADSSSQLSKILQMNPTWEHADQVHLALGLNAEKSGDPATAIHEYQRALALNPSLTLARQHLLTLSPTAPTPNR
jgi:protein O-mannosyl-transferase